MIRRDLDHTCGICGASPGQPCTTVTDKPDLDLSHLEGLTYSEALVLYFNPMPKVFMFCDAQDPTDWTPWLSISHWGLHDASLRSA